MAPTGANDRYQAIYSSCYGRVYAYCLRRVTKQHAADLTADVFAVAWKKIDAIPDGDDAIAWLYAVAYRMVSNHWRSQGRRRKLGVRLAGLNPVPALTPDSQLVQRQDYRLAVQSLSQLKPKNQEVIRLALWEELSHPEIATVLGISPDAVRQRFHRAKQALAREFERAGGTVDPPVAQKGGES